MDNSKLANEVFFGKFKWGELFPNETLLEYGKASALFLDNRLPWILNALRVNLGPVIANDYIFGGKNSYRGYRPFNCKIGAENSQHKFGRAIDFKVKGMTADEVRDVIKKDQKFWLEKGVTRVENKVSWIHIDLGMVKTPFKEPQKEIYFFEVA